MAKELTSWTREIRFWFKDLRLFLFRIPHNRVEMKGWAAVVIVWFICLTSIIVAMIRR